MVSRFVKTRTKLCVVALAMHAIASLGCAARPPAAVDAEQAKPRAEDGGEALRQRQAVSRVLLDFRESLEGVAARRVMELLDESFDDLPRFEDALTSLMRQTLERRVHFRESSWEVKGDRASITVDAEMILTARTRNRAQQRRRERIQFDFVKTEKGWKVLQISPRAFFAP